MYIGIDLALRKTGIVVLDDKSKFVSCEVISSDPKKHNDEALLLHNRDKMLKFFCGIIPTNKRSPINISLEGLSFNSPSASVDLIAANHWIIRCDISQLDVNLNVISPKSWQKSIIDKEVLKFLSDSFPTVRAKKGKKLTKEEAAANTKAKAQRRKETKIRILAAVPDDIKDEFDKYILTNKLPKDTILDLADAYHIAKYVGAK